MPLVHLRKIRHCISTAAMPSYKFYYNSRCLSDVTKSAWMLFGLKGTEEGLRRWFIVGKYVKDFIWNVINLTSNSLILSGPLPWTHSVSDNANPRRQKSLWARPVPRVNGILFTNMLSSVTRVTVTRTSAFGVLYHLLLFEWPLTMQGFQCGYPREKYKHTKRMYHSFQGFAAKTTGVSKHNARISVKTSFGHKSTKTL